MRPTRRKRATLKLVTSIVTIVLMVLTGVTVSAGRTTWAPATLAIAALQDDIDSDTDTDTDTDSDTDTDGNRDTDEDADSDTDTATDDDDSTGTDDADSDCLTDAATDKDTDSDTDTGTDTDTSPSMPSSDLTLMTWSFDCGCRAGASVPSHTPHPPRVGGLCDRHERCFWKRKNRSIFIAFDAIRDSIMFYNSLGD